MADREMILPAVRIGAEAGKKVEPLVARLKKWNDSGRGMVRRLHTNGFSQVADPRTGTYERLY